MTVKVSQLKAAIRLCNGGLAKLKTFNDELRQHFDREDMGIFYQPSDGWVLMYEEDKNVPLFRIDVAYLLTLSYEQAVEYLNNYSI